MSHVTHHWFRPQALLTITLLAATSLSAFAKNHNKIPSARVKWKDVPPAAQLTIQSNAAGGKVVEVTKAAANGITFYSAEVKGTDHQWIKVYVTEAGILMKVEPDKARNSRKHKPLFGNESLLTPVSSSVILVRLDSWI
jgi:hypothetical protein